MKIIGSLEKTLIWERLKAGEMGTTADELIGWNVSLKFSCFFYDPVDVFMHLCKFYLFMLGEFHGQRSQAGSIVSQRVGHDSIDSLYLHMIAKARAMGGNHTINYNRDSCIY